MFPDSFSDLFQKIAEASRLLGMVRRKGKCVHFQEAVTGGKQTQAGGRGGFGGTWKLLPGSESPGDECFGGETLRDPPTLLLWGLGKGP